MKLSSIVTGALEDRPYKRWLPIDEIVRMDVSSPIDSYVWEVRDIER
jgi:hypothetical protein